LKRFIVERSSIDDARARMQALTLTPNEARTHGIMINQDGKRRTALEVLAYEGVALRAAAVAACGRS